MISEHPYKLRCPYCGSREAPEEIKIGKMEWSDRWFVDSIGAVIHKCSECKRRHALEFYHE